MSDSEKSDVDARFAEIVAHWEEVYGADHDSSAGSALTGPSDVQTHGPGSFPSPLPSPLSDDQGLPVGTPPPAGTPAASFSSRAELEEHFEPPRPQPLPAGDLQFWGIVLGLCGGPLLLLYLIAFDRDAGSLFTAAAILMTLGGFGLLVARQPHRRPDDGDDGARL